MAFDRIDYGKTIFRKIGCVSEEISVNYQNIFSWSSGIVLHEIFTLGCEPYEAIHPKQLQTFLLTGNRMEKPIYADENM